MQFTAKKGIRGLAALAAMAVMVPLVASCGNSSSSASGGTTKISFYSYFKKGQIGSVIDAFEKKNPNIKIDMQAGQDPSQYVQTLQTRLAGGQPPAVFNLTMDNRTDVMSSGAALDLTGSDFFDGIDESNFELFKDGGKTYAMPVTAWYGSLIFNKDILKKAGYTTIPKTWSEFLEMGKKITKQGKTAFLEDINSGPAGSIAGLQASYYASKGITTNMNEDIWSGKSTFEKEWTPVLTEWVKMVKEGVLPTSTVGISSDQVKQQFMTGELAVMRSGPWDYTDLQKSGVNFGAAAFPSFDEGGEQWINGGPDEGFAISSKAPKDQQEAAKKFLAFLNTKEALKLFTDAAGTQSLSSKYTAKSPDVYTDIVNNYLNKGKYYWTNWPKAPSAMLAEDIAVQQQLVQGKLTPEQAAQKLDEKWQSVK